MDATPLQLQFRELCKTVMVTILEQLNLRVSLDYPEQFKSVQDELRKGMSSHSSERTAFDECDCLFMVNSYLGKLYKAVAMDRKLAHHREPLNRAEFILNAMEMVGWFDVLLNVQPLTLREKEELAGLVTASAVRHAKLEPNDSPFSRWMLAMSRAQNSVRDAFGS